MVVIGNEDVAMIGHKHIATDPCAVFRTSKSEPNKRVVNIGMREDLLSASGIRRNEINRVVQVNSLETRKPAFHARMLALVVAAVYDRRSSNLFFRRS